MVVTWSARDQCADQWVGSRDMQHGDLAAKNIMRLSRVLYVRLRGCRGLARGFEGVGDLGSGGGGRQVRRLHNARCGACA